MTPQNTELNLNEVKQKLHHIIRDQQAAYENARKGISGTSGIYGQADSVDQAQANADMQVSTSLMRQSGKMIQQCQFALKIIQQGEYGICQGCFDDIENDRLIKNPYITKCSDCTEKEERQERHHLTH